MKTFVVGCSLMTLVLSLGHAQEGYRLPPQVVVDLIDAAPEPAVRISPDGDWMLLIERDAMPGIDDVSRPMLRLAGVRIDPVANSRFRTSFDRGLSLRKTAGGEPIEIPLADDAKLAATSWCHDSKSLAFVVVTKHGSELWITTVGAPKSPRRLTDRLSTVMGGFQWLPDGNAILCRLVPESRGDEPTQPNFPVGPNIQHSSGNTSPTRTYQDLLSNPHDEALFEHYATNQLAAIDLDANIHLIAKPALFAGASASPDGKHILVTTVQKPFSYLMTYRSFPRNIQVWDMNGKLEYEVARVPLAENIPIEGVRTGPRNVDWHASEDATLLWAEALDGGDPRVEVDHRDRFLAIAAPFDGNPGEILRIEHRSYGVTHFADPAMLITTEYDRDRRWLRSLLHDLRRQGTPPRILMDRSIRDRYGNPGSIRLEAQENGHRVVQQDGDWIYRFGSGASPKGDLPFVDRQNLKTLESERLWRCVEGTYERAVMIRRKKNGEETPQLITVREDPFTPPNYMARDLAADTSKALTHFADPTPQIRGIKKQLVTYERKDGVPLSATLYLPADYTPGTRLPLIVWAYPREFSDARTAGQVSGSTSRFTRIRGISHLSLLTQGYAIMDNATMPVIGDPETMNDTFIEQIVAAAQAAIDKAVALGVADRHRVGVAGHSYGAFMTANLLAHCDLFKAGVARSGAYNRTLTPFGFQSERRTLWDAKSVYFGISPFLHANKINEPILLIHGEADNNSGTFPMQSRRMYQAIKGNGGTVRLVMLPKESHGYRARESVLHTQAEMIDWFDEHVKGTASDRNRSRSEGSTSDGKSVLNRRISNKEPQNVEG